MWNNISTNLDERFAFDAKRDAQLAEEAAEAAREESVTRRRSSTAGDADGSVRVTRGRGHGGLVRLFCNDGERTVKVLLTEAEVAELRALLAPR